MREANKYEKLLEAQWPGMAEAMVNVLTQMEGILSDPWLGAKIKAEGPQKFKVMMAEQLKPELAKISREVLLDVASQLLTTLLLESIKMMLDKEDAEGL